MRSIPVLILFGFSVVVIHSRPSQTDASSDINIEEADYNIDLKADDVPESELKIESVNEVGQIGPSDISKTAYTYEPENIPDRPEQTNLDISELKAYNRNKAEDYEDTQNCDSRRETKYKENKEPSNLEIDQRITNFNANFPKSKRYHNKMLLDDTLAKMEYGLKKESNIQGEMLFGTRGQDDKSELVNESPESNKPYSSYYDQMNQELDPEKLAQAKNRDERNYFSRERRDASDLISDARPTIEAEKDSDNAPNEDEETVIKRHIKKLSSDELEELLSSLTDEKKELLKSIMDEIEFSPRANELNKREITKKAGAVEEISNIVSGQIDSNISGDNSASESEDKTTEVPLHNNANTDISRETEGQPESNTDISTERNLDEKNSFGVDVTQQIAHFPPSSVSTEKDLGPDVITNDKLGSFLVPNNDKTPEVPPNDKSSAQVVSDIVTSKTENKRETNIDELADVISFEDTKLTDNHWVVEDSKEQCSCSQDEELSQFTGEDQLASNDAKKIFKRDIQTETDYDSKLKSLEESFPKSSSYDEVDGPLIRVKRMSDPVMKKRAAAILSDSKVSYFPYRAENEDEDNDEGDEFEDDRFYDGAPSMSNENPQQSNLRDSSIDNGDANLSLKENVEVSGFSKDKVTSNLGSDTDGVLSGVEGEDENMFSSGSRNRRTSDEISDDLDESNSIDNAKSFNDDEAKAVPNNVVTYEESDSFGPLPRRIDGDTGRYKRIRRVKEPNPKQTNINS